MRRITLNIYQRGDRVYYLRFGEGKEPWSLVTATISRANVVVEDGGVNWRYDLTIPESIENASYGDIFVTLSDAKSEADRRNGKRNRKKSGGEKLNAYP